MYDDVTKNTHTQLFINNQMTCGLVCTLFVEHIFKCALSEDCNATGVAGLRESPQLSQIRTNHMLLEALRDNNN